MKAADVAPIYTSRGWAVLPLQPRGKLPLTEHGSKDATTDRERVVEWWRRWPSANAGIATGTASRLLVVDLDGEEGVKTWQHLLNVHGAAATLTAKTGSGGFHLYFSTGAKLRNSARLLGPGVDTRGEGGYVVAPPSVHPSGGVYGWARRVPVAPAPAWLAQRLARHEPPRHEPPRHEPPRHEPPRRQSHRAAFSGQSTRYGRVALDRLAEELARAGEGTRNDALNRAAWAAGLLVAAGHLAQDDCEQALLQAAQSAGLPACEVERTFRSGFGAGFAGAAA